MSESAVGDFGTGANRFQNVPGQWVPWCVAHQSRRTNGEGYRKTQRCQQGQLILQSDWLDRLTPCRWHPKGAFIPDTEKGD